MLSSARRAELKVGIVGGSISRGSTLRSESDSYAAVLGRMPGIRVLNRAVGATGCVGASYCLDQMLPEAVDVVVIEFAANDAGGCVGSGEWRFASYESSVSGQRIDPEAAMERLLWRVALRRLPDAPVPLLLHVCNPRCGRAASRCERLYSGVAEALGVRRLSLQNSSQANRSQLAQVHWEREHPDKAGHFLIADLVRNALRDATRTPLQPRPPATPRVVVSPQDGRPSAEAQAAWRCHSCDWHGCTQFAPRRRGGFALDNGGALRREPNAHAKKWGWTAVDSGGGESTVPAGGGDVGGVRPELAFRVPAAARVLVAFLCSYQPGAGNASVSLWRTDISGPASVVDRGAQAAAHNVVLRWAHPSSQQCLFEAARTGAEGTWEVRVAALAGLVKVFGLYHTVDMGTVTDR